MMPPIDDSREQRRKKRAPVISLIVVCSLAFSAPFQPGWQWVPLTIGIAAAAAVGASIDWPGGRRRDRRRRGTITAGRGHEDNEPARAATGRWHALTVVSRLMPGPAGRRWLAEAESVLSEIAPVRRGAAIRSYLRSAPGLIAMTWVHEVLRRARLGPRRPG